MKRLFNLFQQASLSAGLFLCCSSIVLAQSEKPLIRDGNKAYEKGKYADSEISYRKSLEKNNKSFEGEFNLGDALYKQGKYEEAAQHFSNIASNSADKEKQAHANHNLGNSLLQQKKYPESIEAFKKALKSNPNDQDTKYNLAYAQQMIRQEQQQQQKKDNKDNKDNKDKKDQEGSGDKQDQKEGNPSSDSNRASSGTGKEQQQQAGKPKDKISKEDAERILQALNQDEKNTQKKLSRKEATRIQIEKDW